MAHQVETMMYSGHTPWHGLGEVLPAEGFYDTKIGIEKAGMNWGVEKVPLFSKDGDRLVEVPGTFGVRRSTDGRILGTVGDRYTLLQNADAFAWFQPFLDAKEAQLHTAGSLANGSRVWVLAKLNRDPMVIKGNDIVEKFVLLSHSFDGSLSVRLGLTGCRVVCSNTLSIAHGSASSKMIRLRHSSMLARNMEEVRSIMNVANEEFEATAEQYRALARKDINQHDLRKYIKLVLEVDDTKKISTKMQTIIEKVISRAEAGRGNDVAGIRGTIWAAYNGVTEYFSHDAGRNQSNRLNSLWFGEAATKSRKALEIAVQMAS